MNCMIGLRSGDKDNVRAVQSVYFRTEQKLLKHYSRRTLVLPLILGGDILLLGPTFLSTEYMEEFGDPSKFYDSAEQLVQENQNCSRFYVIDTDNKWYYCNGNPRVWFPLEGEEV
jgi:hypothetical protein